MSFQPIYNLHSDSLKDMLSAKDIRTIKKRIIEIGVPIYKKGKKGKDLYIITEELLDALRNKDKKAYIYTPKNKANDFFS